MCNSVLLFVSQCFALSWPGRSCKWELVLNWPTWLNKGEIKQIKLKGECGSGLCVHLWPAQSDLVLIMYCMLYYRWVWCRTLWTSLASPTWTCWRYQSASCQMTWGTCGSVPASLIVPSMWEGRSSRHTNPSWQVTLLLHHYYYYYTTNTLY